MRNFFRKTKINYPFEIIDNFKKTKTIDDAIILINKILDYIILNKKQIIWAVIFEDNIYITFYFNEKRKKYGIKLNRKMSINDLIGKFIINHLSFFDENSNTIFVNNEFNYKLEKLHTFKPYRKYENFRFW